MLRISLRTVEEKRQAAREAQARYRKKHRKRVLAYLRAYRKINKDYFNERKLIDYHDNKEKYKAKYRIHYCKRRSGGYWEAHKTNLELQEIILGKPLTHKRLKPCLN